MEFTHLDETGAAQMVDVSGKPQTIRTARARGEIELAPETIVKINEGLMKKGDVLAVARIAGIIAAKKTYELIPLCHNIEIDCVNVDFEIKEDRIEIESTASCTGKTGIEMEALTAVSGAALAIYDMCKAIDKNMVISNITLIEKLKRAPGA